jgi:hypothetical protein
MILMNGAYSERPETTEVHAVARGELIENPDGVPASAFVCNVGKSPRDCAASHESSELPASTRCLPRVREWIKATGVEREASGPLVRQGFGSRANHEVSACARTAKPASRK